MTKTRFSPSPTGMIHIGNARAALFSALYASKNEGVFLLRIEDTDATRSNEKFSDMLQEDMQWLGLNWQEGPNVGGDLGPYWQSLRLDVYQYHFDQLMKEDLVYPCFCTDQELMLARKVQLSSGQAPRYSGKCLKLSAAEIADKHAEGKKAAWRFKVPKNKTITFDDLVKGPQSFESSDIGDFIIRRADGTSPFLFCNAIDDAMMKVTHVIRGEDHISNTPRQLMLLETLGLVAPSYGHVSLIVGEDGAPLSKRHGSFSVEQLKEQGYLPAAIINYLGRLGHSCDVQGLLALPELATHFSLDKLSVSPPRFDMTQLLYWQKNAVQALSDDEMQRWLGERSLNAVPEDKLDLFIATVRANVEFPADALAWSDVFFKQLADLDEEDAMIVRHAGEQFFVEAENAVNTHGEDIKQVMAEMKSTLNIKGKQLFMPFRVALTGRQHGPELVQIATLLGKDEMCKRLGQAFKIASK